MGKLDYKSTVVNLKPYKDELHAAYGTRGYGGHVHRTCAGSTVASMEHSMGIVYCAL